MKLNYLISKVLVLLIMSLCMNMQGQITGTGCPGLTEYTNGLEDDSIYYYPVGINGTLTATPPSGTPGWNFVWSKFVVGSTSWALYSTDLNVATSTITNLSPGAYSVTIIDGTGVAVGCYSAWIAQVLSEASVDISPIPPSCAGPVSLNGTIDYGSITAYSNLPISQMLVDANTTINVCFTATHSWVSDLAFYMIGPASCGSPTLLLLPNPGAIGQGAVCNSGNNITNFCFSTESPNNINVCNPAPTSLSGTYGSYGPGNTPISWNTVYGCDASSAGWSVQIYDCIGGDVGSLTDATIAFTGTDACGQPQTISYSTPPGYSSPIFDNTCSASSASIFTVPSGVAAPPIACDYGFEWNSDPYVYIADSTTSLNIQLNQLIDASGNVMPWQSVLFSLTITSSCDSIASGEGGCFGGDGYDEEMFNILPIQQAIVDPAPVLCVSSSAQLLTVNIPGGTWAGTGITDAINGVFNPASVGIGTYSITYSINDPCIMPGFIDIIVAEEPQVNVVVPSSMCIDDAPVDIESLSPNYGFYAGNGITDPTLGTFDPQVAGIGQHIISVAIGGICPTSADDVIEVFGLPIINAGADDDVCPGAAHQLNANGAGAGSYSWQPATFLNFNSIVNPVANISSSISYTVTGVDIHGCVSTDDVTLTLLPEPEVEANSLSMICPGESVQLEAAGSVGSYVWTPSAGLIGAGTTSATATPQVTTTYTITLTDACKLQATATVLVPVEEVYEVNAGDNAVYCENENVLISGEVVGANPAVLWTTTNGVVPGNGNTLDILVGSPGDYFLNVTTPLGCLYDDMVQVSETPLPVLSLVDDVNLCPDGDVIIYAGNNWDQVLWSNGLNTPDITVNQPGTYGVTVTNNGCQNSGSINVNLVFLPYLELGPDVLICQNEAVSFVISAPGQWSTGDSDDAISVSAAGTYSVIIYQDGCSVEDSVRVQVDQLPFVELGPPIVGCVDQSVFISALHEDSDSYLWNTGESAEFITVYTPDIYSVTVENNCGSMTDFVDVSFEDCTYSIYIPNSFTPDNDGINDVWRVSTFNVVKMKLNIFNRWGDIVFSTEDPQAVWTGQADEGTYYVPDGVYLFHLTYETELKELGEREGTITIVR